MKFKKSFFKILLLIILFPCLGIVAIFLNYKVISFSVRDQLYTDVSNMPFQPFTLVLGTGNYSPEKWINYSLIYRAEATNQIVSQNKTNTIIASGFNSELLKEATDLKIVMNLAGVDTTRIITDSTAYRTFISVINAANFVGDNGVIIVSQMDHLERTLFIGNCIGINAIGYVARTPENPVHKIYYREYFARVKCIFDCIKFNVFEK